jgi:glycosyltransferase involved in cell wall biosynthesis
MAPETTLRTAYDKGTVSIVTCFLNAEKFLAEAVQSVLAQTYSNWELVLVDDGSSDGSTQMAQEYAVKFPGRIRRFEHEGHANRGAAASRNLGLTHCRGEFFAILDADDVWLPTKLERQVSVLQNNPTAGMVFGRPLYWYSWTGRSVDRIRDRMPRAGVPVDQLFIAPELVTALYPLGSGNAPCPSDLMLRTCVAHQISGFEEAFTGVYQLYEDQLFLAKVYLAADVFVSGECWSWYRQHSDSCVPSVRRAGDYGRVRMKYFEWLTAYLDAEGIRNPIIERAITDALWWHEHPRLYTTRKLLASIRYFLEPRPVRLPIVRSVKP